MKKFSVGEIVKPTVVLMIICLVTSALLAVTNEKTAPKIAELAAQTELNSRKLVLSGAESFEEATAGEIAYCIGKDASGSTAGYIFTTSDKGYGGEVKIMVGISSDGKVAGVQTLILNETVGLGMKAKEESFLKQFVGKFGEIGVAKNNPNDNEIQALTGATITSKAVTAAVNKALDNYANVTGGANNG